VAVQGAGAGPIESQAESLAEWVRRAQRGEAAAFDELLSRSKGLARKTAYPLLPAHQLDDALQEAYLTVFQKLHYLRDPLAFQAWLVRIVLHVAYAMRKKAPPRVEAEGRLRSEDGAAAVARRLDLKAALERLKEDDRNILILRELLGMSYEEIAYALRLPLGTVRSRLHHGRKKLAALLTP
jgi:RNA polymerase sigma-70 factor (ECF subfamily)